MEVPFWCLGAEGFFRVGTGTYRVVWNCDGEGGVFFN